MRKMNILAAALALVLVACAGVGSAHAYFTTYAEAQGGHILELGDRTELHEDFYDWTKHVTISSDDGSRPVYVRARAFSTTSYELRYGGEGWTRGDDGWYYYDNILYGGETTPELLVQITGVPEDEYLQNGDQFNVSVVYETTPVIFDADGNGDPAQSWAAQTRALEGGGN